MECRGRPFGQGVSSWRCGHSSQWLPIIDAPQWKKILIRGNHDIYPLKDYATHFKDVRGAFFLEGIILTHIPIHPDHFRGSYKGNAHGHLHASETMLNGQPDRRYFNSCVEMHDFFPVPWEEVKASFLQ